MSGIEDRRIIEVPAEAVEDPTLRRAVDAMHQGRLDEAEHFLGIAERTAHRDALLRFSVPFYRVLLEERRGRLADALKLLSRLEQSFLVTYGKPAPEMVELRQRLEQATVEVQTPQFVRHPKFGRGRVIERIPGAREKLVVAFEAHGTKTLLADVVEYEAQSGAT